MSLIAIDAFAGAGGLSLGLRDAGFEVVFAYDNDPVAIETYNTNLPPHAECLDGATLGDAGVMERTGLVPGECDLLAGGPPCQGFSIQRNGGSGDPRNLLVLSFLEQILSLEPKVFLMENVPALMSRRGRHLVEQLIAASEEAGYSCASATLNAVDFGVPQRRRRTFVLGVKGGSPPRWPEPTTTVPLTVETALNGLPSPPEDGSPHPDVPNHYRERRLSELNRERIRHIPPGGGREHLPPHLRLRCHRSGHRHLDTYGRLAWDEPAVTLTARFDSFTRGRFGHPVEDRTITLREGARLQGFPDNFIFLGNREEGARMIGNAVPPPLACALGGAIANLLNDSLSALPA